MQKEKLNELELQKKLKFYEELVRFWNSYEVNNLTKKRQNCLKIWEETKPTILLKMEEIKKLGETQWTEQNF